MLMGRGAVEKDLFDQKKHGGSLAEATRAFEETARLIVKDKRPSTRPAKPL